MSCTSSAAGVQCSRQSRAIARSGDPDSWERTILIAAQYDALRSPHPNVWNVRAPYARYLELHKQLNKAYQLRQITLDRMKAEHKELPLEENVTVGMLTSLSGRPQRIAVKRYGQRAQTVLNLLHDIEGQYYESNKDMLLKISTLFEQFVLCWCCNMLLATLENRNLLSKDQAALIAPIAAEGTTPRPKQQPGGWHTGGITQIIRAFPQFQRQLDSIPRRKTDPGTRKPEGKTSDRRFGAVRVVSFWRAVRNQILHKYGLADKYFIRDWLQIWELLRLDLRGIPLLQQGSSIPLRPVHVAASFTTHDLLAKGMRDILISYSSGRRGHVFSPGKFRGAIDPEKMPDTPALFVPGDWK